jgi:uncharacterized protein (TIGR00255 family)
MPIYSMTGFARVQVRIQNHDQDQLSYTLSLKSVNHRFLDVQLRIPNGLDALEMDLRKAIKDALVRGHVDLTLSVDRATQQKAGFNRELIAGYGGLCRRARGLQSHRRTGPQRCSAAAGRIAGRQSRRRRFELAG